MNDIQREIADQIVWLLLGTGFEVATKYGPMRFVSERGGLSVVLGPVRYEIRVEARRVDT